MKNQAAIVIKKEEQILFIRRSEKKKTLPGIWSFPSGTKEESENIFLTAIREAKEELGVKVKTKGILTTTELSEFKVRLHFVLCSITVGEPFIKDQNEISALSWLTFPQFFEKHSDEEIGHGLRFLRKNPLFWSALLH